MSSKLLFLLLNLFLYVKCQSNPPDSNGKANDWNILNLKKFEDEKITKLFNVYSENGIGGNTKEEILEKLHLELEIKHLRKTLEIKNSRIARLERGYGEMTMELGSCREYLNKSQWEVGQVFGMVEKLNKTNDLLRKVKINVEKKCKKELVEAMASVKSIQDQNKRLKFMCGLVYDNSTSTPNYTTTQYTKTQFSTVNIDNKTTRYSTPYPVILFNTTSSNVYNTTPGYSYLRELMNSNLTESTIEYTSSSEPLGRSLYIFGGWNGYRRSDVNILNLNTKTWSRGRNLIRSKSDATAVAHNDNIYLIGGLSGKIYYKTLDIYNVNSNRWTSGPRMQHGRHGPGAVVVMNTILVCGGEDYGSKFHDNCEVYNINEERWVRNHQTPPMNEKRDGFSMVLVDNKIYAIGGWNRKKALRSVECINLNPENNVFEWKYVDSMMKKRRFHASVVYKRKIYVSGGYDSLYSTMQSVEVYDTANPSDWKYVEPLMNKKRGHGMIVDGDRFLSFGGAYSSYYRCEVEQYDTSLNYWETVSSMRMPSCKAYFGYAII